ncbi:hypothetical protein JCM11491_005620 [Sporobolomyces phaffii]
MIPRPTQQHKQQKYKKDLQGELPWILGGIFPIVCDALLVASIFAWQRAWAARPDRLGTTTSERTHVLRLEADLERLRAAVAHREEILENVRVGIAAVDHHAHLVERQQQQRQRRRRDHGEEDNETPRTRRRRRDQVLEVVTGNRTGQGTISPLLEDWHRHATQLQPTYKSRTRDELDRLDEQHGALGLAPLSAYSASDPEYSSESAGERAVLAPPRSSSSRSRRRV